MPPETQCDNCGIISEFDPSRPQTCFQCSGNVVMRKMMKKLKAMRLVDMLGSMELQVLAMPMDAELQKVIEGISPGYPKPKLGRVRQRVAPLRKPAKTVTITQGKPLARTLRKFAGPAKREPLKTGGYRRATTAADLAGPLRIKRVGIS